VVYRGAGVRLNKKAGVKKVAKAIRKVVDNPEYHRKARELSVKIRQQSEWQKACEELEAAATYKRTYR
jgi:UDP:flavonoid glycosyltransferase YjiC (YdhE family)